jgi:hypothetical protein
MYSLKGEVHAKLNPGKNSKQSARHIESIYFVAVVPAKPSTHCDAAKASQCLVKRELASESAVTNNQQNNLGLHLNLNEAIEGSKFLLRSNLPKRK